MKKPNILILSSESDNSTDQVIKWIKFYGGTFTRINDTSKLKFMEATISSNNLDDDNVEIIFNEKILRLSDFNSYWYRRGRLNINYSWPKKELLERSKLKPNILETLTNEYDYLQTYIYNFFENKHQRKIGSIFDNRTNKLTNLRIAKSCGLTVPFSKIISSKKKLEVTLNELGAVIIKPIHQRGFSFSTEIIVILMRNS